MAITLRSDSELQLIEDVLGSHYQNNQALDDYRLAASINTERQALMKILREFDDFCGKHGINYFIFGDTLKGAVAYRDFLPGQNTIDLGMTREDFEKFAERYRQEEQVEDGDPFEFWKLAGYGASSDEMLSVAPELEVRKPVPVTVDGATVFDVESSILTVSPYIAVAIFDECPDDFFTRKKFFRKMKRRRDLFCSAAIARDVVNGPASRLKDRPAFRKHKELTDMRAILRHYRVPLKPAYQSMHTMAQKYAGRGMQDLACLLGLEKVQVVSRADLGSYKRISFAGMDVMAPQNEGVWAGKPVMETTPELKILQEDAKIIVEEINRLCEVIGVRYFACGGTVLGYVRHGGFIPWDDDIDVGMLRADYIKFLEEAPKYIDEERFFLQTRETDPNIPYLFSKIRLNGTTYITEYNKDRDFHKGICVDIFPFDFVPNDPAEQVKFKNKARALAGRHSRVVNRQYSKTMISSGKGKKDLDWATSQLTGRLLARYYWSKSLDDTQEAYDKHVQKLNASAQEKGLKYVASFVPTYTMVSLDDLLPYERVDFEGIALDIPQHPEVFLRMQYGDFMEMPYPHQCTGHDLLVFADEAAGVSVTRDAGSNQ